jgi:hypothetical protein
VAIIAAAADGFLFGDVLAFGMTLCMAIMMLIVRQHHETPMLNRCCLCVSFGASVSTAGPAVHRAVRGLDR